MPRLLPTLLALAAFACGGSTTPDCPAPGSGASATTEAAEVAPAAPEETAATGIPACPTGEVAVRVLGSGGPVIDDDRASCGYLLVADGAPRLMIDAGGGTAVRLGALGVQPRDLDGVLLSHMHVDHTADFIQLLKSASFADRSAPLPVVGPTGDETFPALTPFLEAQLGETGAWRYLGGYLRDGQPFPLALDEAPHEGEPTSRVVGDFRVEAVGVPHGPVPALGFVVHAGGERIAFAGDQRLDDPRFLELARGADLLVAHHAIPESAEGMAARLHAKPSQIGDFAAEAGVGRVVLSHHMKRALDDLERSLELIGERYEGPVDVATDLSCWGAGG